MTSTTTETSTMTETTQEHWDRRVTASPFNTEVHRDDVRKGARISFTGHDGSTVYGIVGGLTHTGYRVAVLITALNETVWISVDAADVTLAPFPKPAPAHPQFVAPVETTQEHWGRLQQGMFNPEVHRDDVRKGTRIGFPGAPGRTIYGVVGSLTETGYSVAVHLRGISNAVTWVKVDASEATPAPFPRS
jgi:hypothetical protein